jgi:hypothetical protein
MIGKEVTVAQQMYYHCVYMETDKNNENPQSGKPVSRKIFEPPENKFGRYRCENQMKL